MGTTISTNCYVLAGWMVASQWSVIDSSGTIYVFFLDSAFGGTRWVRSTDGGATWTGEALVGAGLYIAHVTIDSSDYIYMTTTDTVGGLYLNKWDGVSWGGLEVVASDYSMASSSSIDCNPSTGEVRVAWSTTAGEIKARNRSGAGVWGSTQAIASTGTASNCFIHYAPINDLWTILYDDTSTATIWMTSDIGAGWLTATDNEWIGKTPMIVELSTGEFAVCYNDDSPHPSNIMFRETTGGTFGDEVTIGDANIFFAPCIGRNDVDDIIVIADDRANPTSFALNVYSRPSETGVWHARVLVSGLGSSGYINYATQLVNTRTGENPFCIYPVDSTSSIIFESIYAEVGPIITNTSLDSMPEYMQYLDTIDVVSGTAPFTYEISDGSLPDGLEIDEDTGVIYGASTASGTFTFTVKVTDSIDLYDEAELDITITEAITAGYVRMVGEDATSTIFTSIKKIGEWAWLFNWAGDTGDSYKVYNKGAYIETITKTSYKEERRNNNYEPPMLDIIKVE